MKKKRPCKGCPWRKDADLEIIPRYEEALHRNLIETCGPNGLSAMACHLSDDDNMVACSGHMVQVGFESIGVRMLAAYGIDHPDNHSAEGMELYETIEDTLTRHE